MWKLRVSAGCSHTAIWLTKNCRGSNRSRMKLQWQVNIEGGHTGIYCQGTQAILRGPGVSGSGQNAARFLTGYDVDLGPTRFSRNGLNRIATPGSATREIIVEVGALVRHHGGTLGNDGTFVEYNVSIPTSDPAIDKRYHAMGVRVMGAATARTVASSATDFLLTACQGAAGAAVTS